MVTATTSHNQPLLEVMIAAYGAEGLEGVAGMRIPQVEGVRYLVSCQWPEGDFPELPESLRRPDLDLHFSRSRGAARNRNILLSRWQAPYGLVADDDLDYTVESLQRVITDFQTDPTLDFAAYKVMLHDGTAEKIYPDHSFDMRRPTKGYFPGAPEFALRRESLQRAGICYNENFGVGTERFASGEDDLLLEDMLRAGLKGRFIPEVLCVHYGASTGIRSAARPGVLRAQGAVLHRSHPLTAPLRLLLKARRTSRMTGAGTLHCLRHLLSGWKEGVLHGRRLYDAPASIKEM